MLVVGGRTVGDVTLDTTEILRLPSRRWDRGPALPYPVEQHCTVRLNNSHILVTGGIGGLEPILRYPAGFILDIDTGHVAHVSR